MSFLHLCSVSGQQVQSSKQSHSNSLELIDFCKVLSGRQVFQNNCEYLTVFSRRDYIVYTLFLFIFTFYKTKDEKPLKFVTLILSNFHLPSYYYL